MSPNCWMMPFPNLQVRGVFFKECLSRFPRTQRDSPGLHSLSVDEKHIDLVSKHLKVMGFPTNSQVFSTKIIITFFLVNMLETTAENLSGMGDWGSKNLGIPRTTNQSTKAQELIYLSFEKTYFWYRFAMSETRFSQYS